MKNVCTSIHQEKIIHLIWLYLSALKIYNKHVYVSYNWLTYANSRISVYTMYLDSMSNDT